MSKKICIVNMKGGVGKSTLTVQLAWHYATYSDWLKRVLVVDIDPQFNASQYLLGVAKYKQILDSGLSTVYNLFSPPPQTPETVANAKDVVHNVVNVKGGGKIDLMPSQIELAMVLRSPQQKEEILAKAIGELQDGYDIIFIDCPPTESLFTVSAYLASDYALVPVKPEFLSTIGLPLMRSSLNRFSMEHQGHSVELAGVVFNETTDRGEEEKRSKIEVMGLAMGFGWYVFRNEIRHSRSYSKSAREGKPIFWTPHARRQQKETCYSLADELAKRVRL